MKLSDIEDAFNLVFSRKFLVPTPNGARFQHELVRVATYGRMTPHQKQHAHTVLLREILLQGANTKSIDMIVHHADGAQDAETVLEYAPRAATLAAQFGANKEAADHLRRALRYCESASIEDAAVINETWAYEAGIALTIDDAVIAARRRGIVPSSCGKVSETLKKWGKTLAGCQDYIGIAVRQKTHNDMYWTQ